jgi:ArsR family transcriptional regulator, virulence genes transcriptional regulator
MPIIEHEPATSTSARPDPGPAELRRLAARLKAVSAPGRLFVLLHLLEGERSVGELHDGLAGSPGDVSRMLVLLRLAGLVDVRRIGHRRFNRLTDAGRGLMLAVSALGEIDVHGG